MKLLSNLCEILRLHLLVSHRLAQIIEFFRWLLLIFTNCSRSSSWNRNISIFIELNKPAIVFLCLFEFEILNRLMNLLIHSWFYFVPQQFDLFTFALDFPFKPSILAFKEHTVIEDAFISKKAFFLLFYVCLSSFRRRLV